MKKDPAIGRAGPSGRDGEVLVGKSRKQRQRVGAVKKLATHRWAAYLRDGRKIGTYRQAGAAASAIAHEQIRLDRKEPALHLERTMQNLINRLAPHKFCRLAAEPMGKRMAFLLCWVLRKGGKELNEYLAALQAWRVSNLRIARSKLP